MSIVALDKLTIVGHRHNKDEVLAGLQELGCLHLIPLTPEGKAAGTVGPSKRAREALRFLASAAPRRRQVAEVVEIQRVPGFGPIDGDQADIRR